MKLVIFSGTTEGRLLSYALAAEGISSTVCVATEYGAEEQGEMPGITVLRGRLDAEEMTALLQSASLCVDATHPYAVEVSRNICTAGQRAGVEVLRLLRDESPLPPDCLQAETAQQLANGLLQTEGAILLTTGAKELSTFAPLGGERLYPRVLPLHSSLTACEEAGIPHANIIAMQGPFSVQMNEALLRQYNIRWLVTKDGGKAGGFAEKVNAAQNVGVRLAVIRRPQETGYSYQEVLQTLLRRATSQQNCEERE